MPWKKISTKKLAKSLGVDPIEVAEKQKLIRLIRSIREEKGYSQMHLAQKVGVTQSRIAQIESGIGTYNISFDLLFRLLTLLGYGFKITIMK